MLTSLNQLLKGTLQHWYQLAGGTLLAVIGLMAAIKEWTVPGWLWGTLAYLLFLWAIVSSYHDVRVERDEAVSGLRDMTDHQRLADELTERCGYAKQKLLTPRNHQFASDDFQAAAVEWCKSVQQSSKRMAARCRRSTTFRTSQRWT